MSINTNLEVQKLTIDDINEGDTYSFETLLTEELINAFSQVSGDVSTLHMDEDFAKERGFESRVCHGMLLGALFSRLVGVHLPGQNALLQSMNLRLLQPAYAGMTLLTQGIVTQITNSMNVIILQAEVSDKRTETVLARAKIQVGLTG